MKIHITDRDGQEHIVEGDAGETLMLPLRTADLVEATCGGSCSCATCHLHIDEQWLTKLPAKKNDEVEILDFLREVKDDSRLACQIIMDVNLDGIRVTVAQEEGF